MQKPRLSVCFFLSLPLFLSYSDGRSKIRGRRTEGVNVTRVCVACSTGNTIYTMQIKCERCTRASMSQRSLRAEKPAWDLLLLTFLWFDGIIWIFLDLSLHCLSHLSLWRRESVLDTVLLEIWRFKRSQVVPIVGDYVEVAKLWFKIIFYQKLFITNYLVNILSFNILVPNLKKIT